MSLYPGLRVLHLAVASLGMAVVLSYSIPDALCEVSAGELVSAQRPTDQIQTAPVSLFINFDTYSSNNTASPSVLDFVRTARDDWGFDGVELSVGKLLRHAGDLQKFENLISEIAKFVGSGNNGFSFHLIVDPADYSTVTARGSDNSDNKEVLLAASYAVGKLPIKSCSVVLASNLDAAGNSIAFERVQSELKKVKPDVVILVESPQVWTGAEAKQFVQFVKRLQENPGTLIRSSSVHYRFDLAVQDFQYSQNEMLPRQAIRLQCSTSELSDSDMANYEREIFRRAIAQQVAANAMISKTLFVSVESSKTLRLNTKQNSNNKVSLGSKTMRDTVIMVRNELNGH